MKVASIALATVLAGFAGQSTAQAIYKYVFPDGRVVYSDTEVPGGRLVEELQPAPAPDPAAVAATRQARLQRAKEIDSAFVERLKSLDQADNELRIWSGRLEEAQNRLEAGREPRPGERTGNVYQGKSRLNDAYWERQLDNEAAVAEAQARVDQARKAIQALR
jgi:hypothetical protein